ncbi:MAG: ATP-dependent Clp protease proteolytic subunit [Beijerinckiaceae bacterium]
MRAITGTLFALATTLWAVSAQAMSFQVVPFSINNCTTECPRVIVASGTIDLGDGDTLLEKLKFLKREKSAAPPVVIINSNGGNLLAALQMGQALRAMKATVIVAQAVPGTNGYTAAPGGCGSACVFTLMGGVRRIVPDESKVAVNWTFGRAPQIYLGNWVQPDPTRKVDPNGFEKNMQDYMRSMGVRQDLATFIRKMPHESFHVMKPEEITRFGLASRNFR